jgi:predicted ester cyclase
VEEDTPLSEAQERNKVLVRPLLGGTGQGRPGHSERDDGPHFVDHHPRNQEPDHCEGYLRVVAEEQGAFSDIRYIIDDQIAEEDKMMTRWAGSGVHDREEYQGFAPTGRWSADKIIEVHRVEGGKIAEEWKEASSIAALQEERLAQGERERERIEQEWGWLEASGKSPCPRRCPHWRAGRFPHSTNQLGR